MGISSQQPEPTASSLILMLSNPLIHAARTTESAFRMDSRINTQLTMKSQRAHLGPDIVGQTYPGLGRKHQ
jgi:hypothetical protein